MTDLWWAVLLLVAGFGLVFLELMVPSFGALGLLAAGAFGGALVLAFSHGVAAGAVFVGLLCMGLPGLLWAWVKVFPRTAMGRRMILRPPAAPAGGRADPLAALAGRQGVARTQLRPSGIAVIDGRRVDVVTEGRLVEAGRPVAVTEVSGNRVVVRELPAPDPDEKGDIG